MSKSQPGKQVAVTAAKKQTVEEAVLSQSLAEIERLSDRPMKAAAMDAEAAKTLNPMTHAHGLITIGRGGEVSMADDESRYGILDTIREKQDMVTARASHQRLALTENALLLAVDAADSIKARNSLERMKAHQLAVLHRLGMKFASTAEDLLDKVTMGVGGWRTMAETQAASVEAARNANAAIRAFAGYDDGWQALDRTRRGGRQTVTVIHQTVAVGPGGQAVVAGTVKGTGHGGKSAGGKRKNVR